MHYCGSKFEAITFWLQAEQAATTLPIPNPLEEKLLCLFEFLQRAVGMVGCVLDEWVIMAPLVAQLRQIQDVFSIQLTRFLQLSWYPNRTLEM